MAIASIGLAKNKKSRRDGTFQGFRHIGLLFNSPAGQGRVAFYLVVRTRRDRNMKLIDT